MECMIPLSELSRRRIRSIGRLVRVGSEDVAMVIRVSDDNKYFDLSKRRVSSEDVRMTRERYNKSKIVANVLQHISIATGAPVQDLFKRIVWPLARQYKHAYDAFDAYKSNLATILNKTVLPEASDEELRLAGQFISTRFVPDPVKILAEINISCVAYEGIEAIRTALRAGLAISTKDAPISIQLIAPPLYVVHTTTVDKDKGRQIVEAAMDTISASIVKFGGSMQVVSPPTVQAKGRDESDEESEFDSDEEFAEEGEFMDNEAEQEQADKVNFDENAGSTLNDLAAAFSKVTLESEQASKKEDDSKKDEETAAEKKKKKKKDEEEEEEFPLEVKKKKKKTGFVE